MKKFRKFITIKNLAYLTFLCIVSIFIFSFALQKEIKIEINKDVVINDNFYGFGAETLPWLWTKENLKQGINEDDIKLNIERIKEMELPLTRIFVPWEIWNPRADYKNFTFESDDMQSLYKTLDIYQEMETSVIIVTVDWFRDSPWHDVKKSSSAVLKLLGHLIKEKGYDCIHYWTLTNEPELTYGWLKKVPFKNYIQIHKLVKEGLKKRKLSVKIICSDEVESESWFKDSVKTLFDTADIFSSHNYMYPNELSYIFDYFRNRLSVINMGEKPKPFFLCEFGFRGSDFGTYTNSFMNDFDYGLLTAELCIEALNNGVSGASIWCLQEILMPDGKKMDIGLWSYKDKNWKPRPVFYAYRLFTKYIKKGAHVLKVKNEGYPQLKVTCIEYGGKKSIFILNKSNSVRKIQIKGLNPGQMLKKYIYSSSGIPSKNEQILKLEKYIDSKGLLKDLVPAKNLILFSDFLTP